VDNGGAWERAGLGGEDITALMFDERGGGNFYAGCANGNLHISNAGVAPGSWVAATVGLTGTRINGFAPNPASVEGPFAIAGNVMPLAGIYRSVGRSNTGWALVDTTLRSDDLVAIVSTVGTPDTLFVGGNAGVFSSPSDGL